jgi:hypothetical protein
MFRKGCEIIFMKKKLIIFNCSFLIGLAYCSCVHNNANSISNNNLFQDSVRLSDEFKLDSLGVNGFREKNCIYDSTQKSWLIIGKKLQGYTKEKIIDLLGKPNDIGRWEGDRSLVLVYYIGRVKINKRVHTFFEILFTSNECVSEIIMYGN